MAGDIALGILIVIGGLAVLAGLLSQIDFSK